MPLEYLDAHICYLVGKLNFSLRNQKMHLGITQISLEIEQETLANHHYYHCMDHLLSLPQPLMLEGEREVSQEGMLLFLKSRLEWTKVHQLAAVARLIEEAKTQVP